MIITETAEITIKFDDANIDDVVVRGDDISRLSVSSQAVSGMGFEIGAVCSAILEGEIHLHNVNKYRLYGAELTLRICKNNVWHNIGIFNVTFVNRNRDVYNISASDNLVWTDKSAFDADTGIKYITNYLSSSKSIYQLLRYVVVDICGLEMAQTQAEIEAMPNGTISTKVFQDVYADTPRDWLSWIAEALSGFVYADENGKIAIGHFGTQAEYTVTNNIIQSDSCDIADFEILLAGVFMMECWNGDYGKEWYVERDGKPNSINIELSDNWIVQGKHYIYGTAMDVIHDIFTTVSAIPYRPFNAVVHTDTMLHIGQCIDIEDDEGNMFTSVITHHSWTLNGGQKIECAGSDTRLLADTKKRTALKRESEKLSSKIENAKGIPVADEEALRQIEADGHLIEGMVYYVADEHEYNA